MAKGRWGLPVSRRVAVVVVLIVAVLGVVAVGFAEPTVVSQTSEWGQVTPETSEIVVRAEVDNPNPVGIPAVFGLRYAVSLNEIVVARGVKPGVGFPAGRSQLAFTIRIDNTLIDDWWVTHLRAGERSTLTIRPWIQGPLGFDQTLPPERQTIETEILEPLQSTEPSPIELGDEPFLVLERQTATWGRATAERMPVTVEARMRNRHAAPISLDGVGYNISMNAVVLGNGTVSTGFSVDPGETATLSVTPILHTPRMVDWWVTHLRNGEETTMTVEVYGIVSKDGQQTAIPFDFMGLSSVFRTDLLGTGETSVEPIEPEGPGFDFQRPEVDRIGLAWGAVTDDVTEILATVDVEMPAGESPFLDLATLETEQTVTINGIRVASDTTEIGALPQDSGSLSFTIRMDNSKVPEWWAEHINRGERSTIAVTSQGTVDVGMTTFSLELPTREQGFSTDLLDDLNVAESQPVQSDGVQLLTIESVRATWGRATPETAPIRMTVTVSNRQRVDAAVTGFSYRVALNDVVLSNGTETQTYPIPAGSQRTIRFTMTLDNSRMDEWWVTHLRNGERSDVVIDLSATVESTGHSETVRLDRVEGAQPLTTDILGDERGG